jgi:uncharacterized membrane protein YfcA
MLTATLALLCGVAVGFSLGLIGGGGSVLATPMLLYVVGLQPPHLAIGTSALAVSMNAFANLAGHARAGHVRWRTAAIFAVVGAAGALLGSSLGKAFDGHRLVLLFAGLMVLIGLLMLRPRREVAGSELPLTPGCAGRIAGVALGAGGLAGFFGIGGGFLIVPGLLFATRMRLIDAVGTSLLAVGTFGLTTAVNYAASGLVDWPVALETLAGGIGGGVLGTIAAGRLAAQRRTLTHVFVGIVFAVACYIVWRSAAG